MLAGTFVLSRDKRSVHSSLARHRVLAKQPSNRPSRTVCRSPRAEGHGDAPSNQRRFATVAGIDYSWPRYPSRSHFWPFNASNPSNLQPGTGKQTPSTETVWPYYRSNSGQITGKATTLKGLVDMLGRDVKPVRVVEKPVIGFSRDGESEKR